MLFNYIASYYELKYLLLYAEKERVPMVISMEPTFGPQAGGTSLTIKGMDFIDPVESIYFHFGNRKYKSGVTSS